MLPTSGYFRGIGCPGHEKGHCSRPYCHFHHSAKKDVGHVASSSITEQNNVVNSLNEGSSNSASQEASSLPVENATTSSKNEATPALPNATVGNQSELLQKLVSEAVKKVLFENPHLATVGVDPATLLTQTATNVSPENNNSKKKIYMRPPDTPSYNPTPIKELNKRKRSCDGDESTNPKAAKYVPSASGSKNVISDASEAKDSGESDATDFSSPEDEGDVDRRNCDFDILEEVLAEHNQKNKIKVKKKKAKALGKLKYNLSNHDKKVEESAMISDAQITSDQDSSNACDGPKTKTNEYKGPQECSSYFLPPSPVFTSSSDGFGSYNSVVYSTSETNMDQDKEGKEAEVEKPTEKLPDCNTTVIKQEYIESSETEPVQEKINSTLKNVAKGHALLPNVVHSLGAPKMSRPNIRSWNPQSRNSSAASTNNNKEGSKSDPLEAILQQMDDNQPASRDSLIAASFKVAKQTHQVEKTNPKNSRKYKVDLDKEIKSLTKSSNSNKDGGECKDDESADTAALDDESKEDGSEINEMGLTSDKDLEENDKVNSPCEGDESSKSLSAKEKLKRADQDNVSKSEHESSDEAARESKKSNDEHSKDEETGDDSKVSSDDSHNDERDSRRRKRKRHHPSDSDSHDSYHRKKRKKSRKRHKKYKKRRRRRERSDSEESEADSLKENEGKDEDSKHKRHKKKKKRRRYSRSESDDSDAESQKENEEMEDKTKDASSEEEDGDEKEDGKKQKKHKKRSKHGKKLKHRKKNKSKSRKHHRKRSGSTSASSSQDRSRSTSRHRSRSSSKHSSKSREELERSRSKSGSRSRSRGRRHKSKRSTRRRSSSRESNTEHRSRSKEKSKDLEKEHQSDLSTSKYSQNKESIHRKDNKARSQLSVNSSDTSKNNKENTDTISTPMPIDPSKIKVEKNIGYPDSRAIVPDLSIVKKEKDEDLTSLASNLKVKVERSDSSHDGKKGSTESAESRNQNTERIKKSNDTHSGEISKNSYDEKKKLKEKKDSTHSHSKGSRETSHSSPRKDNDSSRTKDEKERKKRTESERKSSSESLSKVRRHSSSSDSKKTDRDHQSVKLPIAKEPPNNKSNQVSNIQKDSQAKVLSMFDMVAASMTPSKPKVLKEISMFDKVSAVGYESSSDSSPPDMDFDEVPQEMEVEEKTSTSQADKDKANLKSSKSSSSSSKSKSHKDIEGTTKHSSSSSSKHSQASHSSSKQKSSSHHHSSSSSSHRSSSSTHKSSNNSSKHSTDEKSATSSKSSHISSSDKTRETKSSRSHSSSNSNNSSSHSRKHSTNSTSKDKEHSSTSRRNSDDKDTEHSGSSHKSRDHKKSSSKDHHHSSSSHHRNKERENADEKSDPKKGSQSKPLKSKHHDKEKDVDQKKSNIKDKIQKDEDVSSSSDRDPYCGFDDDQHEGESGNDSPFPDLSALDEISQDDWEQMINSSGDNLKHLENLREEDDVDLDELDKDDPNVMEECLKMYNDYKPPDIPTPDIQVSSKKKTKAEPEEPDVLPSKHRVARSTSGNMIPGKPSAESRAKKKTPAQVMMERYQKLKEQQAELLKQLEKQKHQLEEQGRNVAGSAVSSTTPSRSKQSVVSSSSVSSTTPSRSRIGPSSTTSLKGSPHSTSGTPKRRMSHVPNVNSLLEAKEKIKHLASHKAGPSSSSGSSQTIAQTAIKGGKRVAHTPKLETLQRPTIKPEFGSKVPPNIRQRYLNSLIDECLKFMSEREAFKVGLAEERVCFKRASSRMVYLNLAVNAVKRLRTEQEAGEAAVELMETDPMFKDGALADDVSISEKPSTSRISSTSSSVKPKQQHPVNPNFSRLSHFSVLAVGGQKGSWSIEKPKKNNVNLDKCIKGIDFYNYLKKYVLTDEQLAENGYPVPDPDEKGKALVKVVDTRKKLSPSSVERYCDRCSVLYTVDKWGFPISIGPCVHHWGRSYKKRGYSGMESRYSCCGGDLESDGCCQATTHVSQNYNPNNLRGYVRTLPKDVKNNDYGVYALDCEMCYTTAGNELTRITVINTDGKSVYEQLVKPENPIIDYNTRFSGITEEDMEDVKTTLRDVQASLLTRFSDKTILIGHSLESDLHAMKIIHYSVVDTSVVFPHKMGPPFKRALRNLASEYLKKIIQNDVSGHDSAEDAIACMHLMQWRIKEDLKGFGKK